MMKFLRSQSQTVLWFVLAFIALGFLFYGNSGNLISGTGGGHTTSDFGRINGEDVSVAQLYDAIRSTRDSLIIAGRAEALKQPGSSKEVAEEAWRQLLLLREADRLHIVVSNKELVEFIQSRPMFQKDGVYSPQIYQEQMSLLQNAYRITPSAYEAVVRNTLRINAVSTALFSTVRTSTQDVATQYEKFYGPTTVSVVSFSAKTYIDAASVKPEEIAAEYKAHPESPDYRTKEKRKVDYVLFKLPPAAKPLTPEEKKAALEALGQKALEFALAFQPDPSANPATPAPVPDFMAEAQKQGLAPATTDFFAADTPPANVPPSPSFNSAAFSLTKDNAISKVVELDNGVAVLHLVEIQPSDLRPLEEVKGDIVKALQQGKGLQAEQIAANTAARALQVAVAKGTDFKTAAAAMNLKAETLPAFVPVKAPQTDPRLQTIAYASAPLTEGKVSDAIPVDADNSFVIVHLDSRAKADSADMAAFEVRFRDSQDQQLRTLVYVDWADWQSKRPGTHKPPDLDSFGGVE